MKNKLQFKSLVAASVLVIFFAITGSAQTEWGPIPQVGGYSSMDTDDPDAVRAAEFAIATKNKKKGVRYDLIEILTARSQSVAGTNYELCIKANVSKDENDEPETKQFLVVAFYHFKDKPSLTSWLEKKCSK